MKTKQIREVRFSIVTFDDNKTWVHVDLLHSGREARTLYQSRADEKLPLEDMMLGAAHIGDQVGILIHEQMKRQALLF